MIERLLKKKLLILQTIKQTSGNKLQVKLLPGKKSEIFGKLQNLNH